MSKIVETAPIVDWDAFEQYPQNTIECTCGAVYRSHSKHVIHGTNLVGVTQTPCPTCSKTIGHIRRASTHGEKQIL